jgi:GNAT superfamily N-acetyltransferase
VRRGLPCLAGALVHPQHRRRGLSTALVAGAVRLASELRGARVPEALLRRPARRRDEALWTELMGAFAANGFVEVSSFEP